MSVSELAKQPGVLGVELLRGHPLVAWVNYPGLAGNAYHALAKRYMPKGAGAPSRW